jgi:hypothetical protein
MTAVCSWRVGGCPDTAVPRKGCRARLAASGWPGPRAGGLEVRAPKARGSRRAAIALLGWALASALLLDQQAAGASINATPAAALAGRRRRTAPPDPRRAAALAAQHRYRRGRAGVPGVGAALASGDTAIAVTLPAGGASRALRGGAGWPAVLPAIPPPEKSSRAVHGRRRISLRRRHRAGLPADRRSIGVLEWTRGAALPSTRVHPISPSSAWSRVFRWGRTRTTAVVLLQGPAPAPLAGA